MADEKRDYLLRRATEKYAYFGWPQQIAKYDWVEIVGSTLGKHFEGRIYRIDSPLHVEVVCRDGMTRVVPASCCRVLSRPSNDPLDK